MEPAAPAASRRTSRVADADATRRRSPRAGYAARGDPRHRRLHGPRAGARQGRRSSAPTSGRSASCSTRCSPAGRSSRARSVSDTLAAVLAPTDRPRRAAARRRPPPLRRLLRALSRAQPEAAAARHRRGAHRARRGCRRGGGAPCHHGVPRHESQGVACAPLDRGRAPRRRARLGVHPWRHAERLRPRRPAHVCSRSGCRPGRSIPLFGRGISGQTGILAISPDGRRIVFVDGTVGQGSLFVRDLENGRAPALDGTERASSPFFSPDGRWVAFFAPGKLRKVAVDGGRPIDLATAELDRGGVWCPDGSIVFAPTTTSGLFRLLPDASEPRPLTEVDVSHSERTHRWPAVVPGGREVAFTVGVVGQPGSYDGSAIDAVDLATGKRRRLFRGASIVRFTSTGTALLARNGELVALPAAGADGASTEDAPVVLRNIAGVPASGVFYFDLASDGTLVYAERDPDSEEQEVDWYTRDGEIRAAGLPKGRFNQLRASPDGQRIAVEVGPGGGRGGDIWIYEVPSGAFSKLTVDGRSATPIWSRDGASVTYAVSLPDGGQDLRTHPRRWQRRGRHCLPFRSQPGGSADRVDGRRLAALLGGRRLRARRRPAVAAAGSRRAAAFPATPATEYPGAASPDGRYVAYVVDVSGRQDLYVQPFPATGARWVVAEESTVALWSADGRELFFARAGELMAAPVSTVRRHLCRRAAPKLFDLPATGVSRQRHQRPPTRSSPTAAFSLPGAPSTRADERPSGRRARLVRQAAGAGGEEADLTRAGRLYAGTLRVALGDGQPSARRASPWPAIPSPAEPPRSLQIRTMGGAVNRLPAVAQ